MDIYEYLSFIPKEANPKNSAKVFFAGEKEDFEKYFEEISEKILSFTEKSGTTTTIWHLCFDKELPENAEELLYPLLGEIHLFVVPVTRNLLLKKGGAMQREIAFAKKHKKPILPILLEDGLLELYSKTANFGNLQFLTPLEQDETALSFERKLGDFLSSVLINDQTRLEVQKAFDAYIFLSYRKKDRALAQELMKLIHKNEFCRDIAIWYDEYLVPGEDFNTTIKEALLKSNLFALMVTPSIIEKGNYIIEHEYPLAKTEREKSGKPILPIESKATDRAELERLYEDIPLCARQTEENKLFDSIISSLKGIALMENKDDPVHNYFIGLAYLNGIDVEIDYEKAHSLIISAAKSGVIEAKKKLFSIYAAGIGTHINYTEALFWSKQVLKDLEKAEKTEDYYEDLTRSYLSHLMLLSAMNSITEAVEPAEKVLEYAKHLDVEEMVRISLTTALFLSDAQKALAAKDMQGVLTSENFAKLNLASLSPILDAEKLLEENKNQIPTKKYSSAMFNLCYMLCSTYWSSGEDEKGCEYFRKAYRLAEENFPEQLRYLNFTSKSREALKQFHSGDVLSFLKLCDEFFQVAEEIAQKHLHTVLPVVNAIFSIASASQSLLNQDIDAFAPYIAKSCELLDRLDAKKLNSNILSQLHHAYEVLGTIYETAKDYARGYTLSGKISDISAEMLLRNDSDENRRRYYKSVTNSASALFGAGYSQDAFALINRAYKLTFDIPIKDEALCFYDRAEIMLVYIEIALSLDKDKELLTKAFDYTDSLACHLYEKNFGKENVALLMKLLEFRINYEWGKQNYQAALNFALRADAAYYTFVKYKREQKAKNIPYNSDLTDNLIFSIDKLALYIIVACFDVMGNSEKALKYCELLLLVTDTDNPEEISTALYAYYVKAFGLAQTRDFEGVLLAAEAFLSLAEKDKENDFSEAMLRLLQIVHEESPSDKSALLLEKLKALL